MEISDAPSTQPHCSSNGTDGPSNPRKRVKTSPDFPQQLKIVTEHDIERFRFGCEVQKKKANTTSNQDSDTFIDTVTHVLVSQSKDDADNENNWFYLDKLTAIQIRKFAQHLGMRNNGSASKQDCRRNMHKYIVGPKKIRNPKKIPNLTGAAAIPAWASAIHQKLITMQNQLNDLATIQRNAATFDPAHAIHPVRNAAGHMPTNFPATRLELDGLPVADLIKLLAFYRIPNAPIDTRHERLKMFLGIRPSGVER